MTINKGYDNSEQKDITVIAINIDYYEELKRKADAWDEKGMPYSVTDAWVGGVDNGITVKNGRCKCGEFVSNVANVYCHKCGQRLEW